MYDTIVEVAKKNGWGGNDVDNFMNKIAEKIGAQDIIRANSQAEAKEAERIRLEAEHYKALMEELRANADNFKQNAEDFKLTAEEYKQHLNEMISDAKAYKESLEELRADYKEHQELLEANETRIHDVGVQVYRNVQAVVEKNQEKNKDEFKEVARRLESIQIGVETKNTAVLPVLIITLLVAGADLVINLLRLFGII